MPSSRSSILDHRHQSSIPLTADGVRQLQARLDDIVLRRMAELRPLLAERERDERDVAAFESLLAEQARLEALLARAEVIDVPASGGAIALGVRARVTLADGTAVWVRPVHPEEAYLDDERISITSPLGSAILGATRGDTVVVQAPVGPWDCRVEEVEGAPRRKGRRGQSS